MANIIMNKKANGERIFRIRVKVNGVSSFKTYPNYKIGEEPIPKTWSDKKALDKAKHVAELFAEECNKKRKKTRNKENCTFSEYANMIIDRKEQGGNIKHTTADGYRRLMKRISDSSLGKMKVTEIDVEDINEFYHSLSEDGLNINTGGNLSNKTRKEYHVLISMVLKQAAKARIVKYNAAMYAEPPKVERKEADCYTMDEMNAILDAIKEAPLKWQAITYLLIGTGARRGEVAALRWPDIDFEQNTIRIQRNVSRVKDMGLVISTPKSGRERTITAPDFVIAILKAWRSEQEKLIGTASISGYCFNETDYSKPIHPSSISAWYWRFSNTHEIVRLHAHAFRHEHASIIMQTGDTATASKRLGHSRISTTTDIYGHMIPKTDQAAADLIENTFFKDRNVEAVK